MIHLNNVREGGTVMWVDHVVEGNNVMEGKPCDRFEQCKGGGNVMWVDHVMEGNNVIEGGPCD